MNNFINECIKGDFRNGTEDRTTQVFISCFNSSSLLRKIVTGHLNLKSSFHNLKATSQVSTDASRIDFIIQSESKVFAIFESKTLLKNHSNEQLKRHGDGSNAKKFLIVLNATGSHKVKKDWKLLYWYDLAKHIELEFKLIVKKQNPSPIDVFILNNLIGFFKDTGILMNNRLKLDDLQIIGKGCLTIQNLSSTSKEVNATEYSEALKNTGEFFTLLSNRLVSHEIVNNISDKKFMRSNFKITGWSNNPDIKGTRYLPSLEIKFELKKPRKNGLKRLFVSIHFDKNGNFKNSITVGGTGNKYQWYDETTKNIKITSRGLGVDDLEREVVKFFEKLCRVHKDSFVK